MIAHLKGILIEKTLPFVIVDVGGVGYELEVSTTTFYQLPEPDHSLYLYTYLCVREDAHLLYGFYDRPERALFKLLIKVSGIGPKAALGVLSGMNTDEFVRCIYYEDTLSLTKIPGIGKKTAERLIIEMRDRLKNWRIELPDAGKSGKMSATKQQALPKTPVQEALEALVVLGYRPAEANQALQQIETADLGVEALIRSALKRMVKP